MRRRHLACKPIVHRQEAARLQYPCHFAEQQVLLFDLHRAVLNNDDIEAAIVERHVRYRALNRANPVIDAEMRAEPVPGLHRAWREIESSHFRPRAIGDSPRSAADATTGVENFHATDYSGTLRQLVRRLGSTHVHQIDLIDVDDG